MLYVSSIFGTIGHIFINKRWKVHFSQICHFETVIVLKSSRKFCEFATRGRCLRFWFCGEASPCILPTEEVVFMSTLCFLVGGWRPLLCSILIVSGWLVLWVLWLIFDKLACIRSSKSCVFPRKEAFHIIYIDAWDIQLIISLSNETVDVCCMFKVVAILSNEFGNNYIQSNVYCNESWDGLDCFTFIPHWIFSYLLLDVFLCRSSLTLARSIYWLLHLPFIYSSFRMVRNACTPQGQGKFAEVFSSILSSVHSSSRILISSKFS